MIFTPGMQRARERDRGCRKGKMGGREGERERVQGRGWHRDDK